ncbi:shikimate dehydrogenase [Xanthomonadaceae bacterium XH05]|nr:shikimate dehydrogenase [Xanthomonadaceae bacterium XH05]
MPDPASEPRYAVLGQPVAHSLSPRIHQRFADALGVALRYEALDVAPEEFAARLESLHHQGLRGANVTLPLKERAARLCRELSPAARLSSAVNTLVRREDGWFGDNTDGVGLCCDLRDNLGVELAGKRVLLIGAGGAARGVVPALFEEGIAELVVANRTPERAAALAEDLSDCGPIQSCALASLAEIGRFGILLNATSASRHGEDLALPQSLPAPGAVAYDLSYGAAAEPFLAWAARTHATVASDGLGMLVEQAAEAFQRWHGIRPDTAPVLRELRAG